MSESREPSPAVPNPEANPEAPARPSAHPSAHPSPLGEDRERRLVISVINYRTAEMTIACARSLLDDMAGLDAHLVIVDNASGDGSAERIAEWLEGLGPETPASLVRSPVNAGFSGGHNIGMAAARGRFHLVFNSDAEARPGALAALLARAEASPEAGVVAPRLEHQDGVVQGSCFRFPSPWSELIRGANSGPLTRLLKRREVALGPAPDLAEIEWVSFAAALLRAEMVARIGPMDEGYFLYSEDAEYCLRARRAGWGVVYAPEARVVHHRGGSAPVKALDLKRKRLPAYYYASRTRFLHAAHGHAGLFAANLAWHAGRALAQTRRLFGKPVRPPAEREARDIWTNFLTPRGDRRAPEG